MQINAVSVFLAVAFWGWLWGVVGIFIAVPVLIVVKIFSDHVPGLGGLQEFLSPRGSEANQPD
jgi:predicted PurR-regulated permease PerM